MKRILTIAVLALSAALLSGSAAAADSYLYWMADDDITWDGTSTSVDYDYVRVSYDGTYLSPYVGGEKVEGTAMTKEGATSGASYWGDIANYAEGKEFLFELYNESREKVAWMSVLDDMSTHILGPDSTGVPTAYTLMSVVPEPTSGILSLFGLAVLALRRRRRA